MPKRKNVRHRIRRVKTRAKRMLDSIYCSAKELGTWLTKSIEKEAENMLFENRTLGYLPKFNSSGSGVGVFLNSDLQVITRKNNKIGFWCTVTLYTKLVISKAKKLIISAFETKIFVPLTVESAV